jgi:hypothetical protein
MQRHIPMAHDYLAKQVNAVIKVLLLVCKRIRVVVVVGVVGFADLVHAVERVKDIKRREVAALVVV